MKLTFEISFPCARCKQNFTDSDLANSNYLLILLPSFILQHQTCPKSAPETYPEPCGFNTKF